MIGAKASISRVKLRLSVAVEDACAKVAYTVPAASVSYIDLQLKASLDTTNKNPYVADAFVILDETALHVIKAAKDAVFANEKRDLVFDKSLFNSVVLTDIVTTLLVFIRNFYDSVYISDNKAINTSKKLKDTFSLADSRSSIVAKFISDGVAMIDGADVSDGLITNISKYFMNMAFATDTAAKSLSKLVSDTQLVTDTTTLSFEKRLFDVFALSDSTTLATSLLKSDTFIVSDAKALDFFKAISGDSVAFSDQIVKNISNKLSDSAVVDDAGWLIAQNYCDITYFLEDYVGEYRTFT